MWSTPKLDFCRHNKLRFALLDSFKGELILVCHSLPLLDWLQVCAAVSPEPRCQLRYQQKEWRSADKHWFALVCATDLIY